MKKLFLLLLLILSALMFFNVDIKAQTTTRVTSGLETLIDRQNISAGTYRYVYSLANYKNFSLQIECTGGVTVTIWASNNPNANSNSDDGWVDISSLIFGQSNITDNYGLFFVDTPIYVYKMMIKYVTTDNTNLIKVYQIRY